MLMTNQIQNKTGLLNLLQEHGDQILSHGVSSLNLFGSFVRDEDIHSESDIDFLVDFEAEKKTFRNLMDLGYFLEDLTGRKVELVTRASLSKFIGPHILKELENVPLVRPRISQTHRRSA